MFLDRRVKGRRKAVVDEMWLNRVDVFTEKRLLHPTRPPVGCNRLIRWMIETRTASKKLGTKHLSVNKHRQGFRLMMDVIT